MTTLAFNSTSLQRLPCALCRGRHHYSDCTAFTGRELCVYLWQSGTPYIMTRTDWSGATIGDVKTFVATALNCPLEAMAEYDLFLSSGAMLNPDDKLCLYWAHCQPGETLVLCRKSQKNTDSEFCHEKKVSLEREVRQLAEATAQVSRAGQKEEILRENSECADQKNRTKTSPETNQSSKTNDSPNISVNSGVTPPVGSPFTKLRDNERCWADAASSVEGGSFEPVAAAAAFEHMPGDPSSILGEVHVRRTAKTMAAVATEGKCRENDADGKRSEAQLTKKAQTTNQAEPPVAEERVEREQKSVFPLRFLQSPTTKITQAEEDDDVNRWAEGGCVFDDLHDRSVYIKYIPPFFPQSSLFKLLSQFGTILKLRTNQEKVKRQLEEEGCEEKSQATHAFIYCFVEYLRASAARQAKTSLSGYRLFGVEGDKSEDDTAAYRLRTAFADKPIQTTEAHDATVPFIGEDGEIEGKFLRCTFGGGTEPSPTDPNPSDRPKFLLNRRTKLATPHQQVAQRDPEATPTPETISKRLYSSAVMQDHVLSAATTPLPHGHGRHHATNSPASSTPSVHHQNSRPLPNPCSRMLPQMQQDHHFAARARIAHDDVAEECIRSLRRHAREVASDPCASGKERFDAEMEIVLRLAVMYATNPTESNYFATERAASTASHMLRRLFDAMHEANTLEDLSEADKSSMIVAALNTQAILVALYVHYGNEAEALKLVYSTFQDTQRRTSTATRCSGWSGPMDQSAPVMFPQHPITQSELTALLSLVLLIEEADVSMAQIFFGKVYNLAPPPSRMLLDFAYSVSMGRTLREALLPGVSNFPLAFLNGSTRVATYFHDC